MYLISTTKIFQYEDNGIGHVDHNGAVSLTRDATRREGYLVLPVLENLSC